MKDAPAAPWEPGSVYYPYAEPWERLAARIKDNAIDGLIVLGAPAVALAVGEERWFLILLPFGILLAILHEIVFSAVWGQTLGKRLQRIRIARIEDGRPPGFKRALIRFVSTFAADIPFVSYLYPLGVFRKDRRMWHDRRAGTVVIRR